MSVGEVYQATLTFTSPSATGEMVFTTHYRTVIENTPISDTDEAKEIALELVDNTETSYMSLVPDVITFKDCTVIGISNPLITETVTSGDVGTDINDAVSMRSAPVVKKLSGLRGRSRNGRFFLMTIPETEQAASVMESTFITSLQTYVDTIKRLSVQASTNVYDMTVFSEKLSTPPTTIVDTLVDSLVVNSKLGSQRKRQAV